MLELSYQCLLAALSSACVSLSVLTSRCTEGFANISVFLILFEAVLVVLFTGISAILFDVYRFGPAANNTYASLLSQYIHARKMIYFGRKISIRDNASYENAKKIQARNLKAILERASKTRYGKDKGLDKTMTIEKFRNEHPLSTYDNYAPYVEKVIAGEEDIMFPGKPVYLGTTSGTTGKYKQFPKSMSYFTLALDYLLYKTYYDAYTKFPSVALKKILTLQTFHKPDVVGCGYKQGPVTSAFGAHRPYFIIPECGFHLNTAVSSTYATLLFGMKEQDVGIISCFFSSSVLVFFQKMELNWRDFCDDIEIGRIRSEFGIPDDKLEKLRSLFKPDPKRAEKLRREFRKGCKGIARRIWPGCKLTIMITTGAFKASSDILRNSYLHGIANHCRIHGGTEGGYGLFRGEDSYDPVYHLAVNFNFYELIPVDEEFLQEAILPHEAEVGKHYELVITNEEGLYRYKTTDVIECVGFNGQTLMYKFSQRIGDTLYLVNEKTPVHVVETAIYTALPRVAPDEIIADFCCTENVHLERVKGVKSGQLSYCVFVELRSSYLLPHSFADEVEHVLNDILDSYRRHRHQGTAEKVTIIQLKPGAFAELRTHILSISKTTAVDQYKAPRLSRHDDFLRVLLNHAME